MFLRIIVAILLGIWLLLLLMGKSGFIHILLLTAICLATVEIVTVYRGRIRE